METTAAILTDVFETPLVIQTFSKTKICQDYSEKPL